MSGFLTSRFSHRLRGMLAFAAFVLFLVVLYDEKLRHPLLLPDRVLDGTLGLGLAVGAVGALASVISARPEFFVSATLLASVLDLAVAAEALEYQRESVAEFAVPAALLLVMPIALCYFRLPAAIVKLVRSSFDDFLAVSNPTLLLAGLLVIAAGTWGLGHSAVDTDWRISLPSLDRSFHDVGEQLHYMHGEINACFWAEVAVAAACFYRARGIQKQTEHPVSVRPASGSMIAIVAVVLLGHVEILRKSMFASSFAVLIILGVLVSSIAVAERQREALSAIVPAALVVLLASPAFVSRADARILPSSVFGEPRAPSELFNGSKYWRLQVLRDLRSSQSLSEPAAMSMIREILSLLRSPDVDLRRAAAGVLEWNDGSLRNVHPSFFPLQPELRQALDDSDQEVRGAAEQAMKDALLNFNSTAPHVDAAELKSRLTTLRALPDAAKIRERIVQISEFDGLGRPDRETRVKLDALFLSPPG